MLQGADDAEVAPRAARTAAWVWSMQRQEGADADRAARPVRSTASTDGASSE